MKTKIGILVLALFTSFFNVQAQRRVVTTARATSYDISDNLDLDAVASIFGDSENLEDFERRLNDPDNRISNLDLNEDGYIDYLRVVENSSDRNSLVVVQAVLDEDVYQDVATIEIERVQNGNPRIQVVGDSYIYGSNYIIEPVFVHTPSIFSFFWGPRYSPWQSPYYWNYYPGWYSYYSPYSPYKYRRHIYAHINYENKYRHADSHNIHFSGDNYDRIRRSDYATRYPDRAFVSRNRDVSNRNELIERRSSSSSNRQRSNDIQRSSQDNRKSTSVGNVNERRRPGLNIQSGSNQNRTRENNNVITTPQRPNQSSGPQFRSANKNEGNPVLRSRSTSTPNRSADQVRPDQKSIDSRSQTISRPTQERSTNRVEAPQRSSAPREKSVSVSRPSRSNSEVKQSPRSDKKVESSQKEEKNESGNNRRR